MAGAAAAFLARVADAPDDADGAALALEFAAELDALLGPVVAAAAAVATAPAPFRLRRAVELAGSLTVDDDTDEDEVAQREAAH